MAAVQPLLGVDADEGGAVHTAVERVRLSDDPAVGAPALHYAVREDLSRQMSAMAVMGQLEGQSSERFPRLCETCEKRRNPSGRGPECQAEHAPWHPIPPTRLV